jgi:hypothetical protein
MLSTGKRGTCCAENELRRIGVSALHAGEGARATRFRH